MSKPQLRPAGFWIRLAADILDSIILNVGAWGIELICLGVLYWAQRLWTGSAPASVWEVMSPLAIQIFNVVLYLMLAAPYYITLQTRTGTTWGKRPFRIQVQSNNGRPMNQRQAVIRFLGYGLSYGLFGAGFLMVISQKDKRALHELISGTRSVIVST